MWNDFSPVSNTHLRNVRVADHFDTILELRSLTREIQTTGWDANSFMTDILLDPTGAAMGLRDRNTARTALCTYPCTGLKRTTSPEVVVPAAENITTEIEHKRDMLEDRRIIPNRKYILIKIRLLDYKSFTASTS
jgi:hypothetical protein